MGLTDEQYQRYESLFKALDTDGNGTLSRPEYVNGLMSMGFKDGNIMEIFDNFNKYDKNGDRKLSIGELMKEFSNISDEELRNAELRLEFQRIDKDKSGSISKTELKKAIKAKGISMNDEVFDKGFAMTDKDGSGNLQYEEALTVLKYMLSRG